MLEWSFKSLSAFYKYETLYRDELFYNNGFSSPFCIFEIFDMARFDLSLLMNWFLSMSNISDFKTKMFYFPFLFFPIIFKFKNFRL